MSQDNMKQDVKKGWFARWMEKLDQKMKDQARSGSCCCSSDKKKGGSCCS